MSSEKLDKMIEDLEGKLEIMKPGTEDYMKTLDALKELREMKLKAERAEDERMDRERRYELDRDRLDVEIEKNSNEVKQAKKNNIWGWIGKITGIIGSILLVFCLDEVKKESIIDKDAFSVARGWFPRG